MEYNNRIALIISEEYNLKRMVAKNIKQSIPDDRCSDLVQHILEQILIMNTEKLKMIVDSGGLKPFIYKMIYNQRNYYKSFYNTLNGDYIYFEDVHPNYYNKKDEEKNFEERIETEYKSYEKYIKVIKILQNNQFGWTGRTQMEMERDLSLAILSMYLGIEFQNDEPIFVKKTSMKEIAKIFTNKNIFDRNKVVYERVKKNGRFVKITRYVKINKKFGENLISDYIKNGLNIIRSEVKN